MAMNYNMVTLTDKLEYVSDHSQFENKSSLQDAKNIDINLTNCFSKLMLNNSQKFLTKCDNNLLEEEKDLVWKECEQELLCPKTVNKRRPYKENIHQFQSYSSLYFPYDVRGLSSSNLPNLFKEQKISSNFLVGEESSKPFLMYETPPPSPFSINPITFGNDFNLFLQNNGQHQKLECLYGLKDDYSPPLNSKYYFTSEKKKPFNRKSNQLLERCRNGDVDGLDLDNIKRHIFTFATDQFGSRFIQQMYESSSNEKKAAIFDCLLPHVLKLSCDAFGNYIIQKLFSLSSELQRSQIFEVLHGNFLKLSLNPFGCRVMQKALETGDSVETAYIANEIEDNIVRCMLDQHGNHVVQRIIIGISTENYENIILRIDKNKNGLSYVDLSLHQYSCRVIQSIIKTIPSFIRFIMTNELYNYVDCLFSHEYGNYVAQKMFIYGSSAERHKILKCFRENLSCYSCNKYASNVIEFCLKNGTSTEKNYLIDKVFENSSENLLRLMISDQYGNYVIQQMIESANETLKKKLIFAVKSMQCQLKNHSFYRNVFNKCTISQK